VFIILERERERFSRRKKNIVILFHSLHFQLLKEKKKRESQFVVERERDFRGRNVSVEKRRLY